MKIKLAICYTLWHFIGKRLPESNAKINFGQKKIRYILGKNIVHKCGKNVNFEKMAIFSRRVEIGDNSGIGVNCVLNGKVIIGKDVMMGPECKFYTTNHEFKNLDKPMNLQGYSSEKQIIIGDDVWIGARVIILPGVKIAKGSIIGAGSVVIKSFGEYSIIGGNPARLIGNRKQI